MKKHNFLTTLAGLTLLISACGSGEDNATPTLSVELIQTEAVATFASGQTQTAVAMPTDTPTITLTPSPTYTSTPAQTNTPVTPIVIIPTSSCYSLAFISDVTIPDNTKMAPGQKFTKTWRVRNNGSCAWEAGFKFNYTGGEAMGGSPLTLDKAVKPGSETELSVDLTAPNTEGSYRGNWRMTNAAGTYFGDEVFVLIIVEGSASTPNTPTATGASTKTETPTLTPTVTPTS